MLEERLTNGFYNEINKLDLLQNKIYLKIKYIENSIQPLSSQKVTDILRIVNNYFDDSEAIIQAAKDEISKLIFATNNASTEVTEARKAISARQNELLSYLSRLKNAVMYNRQRCDSLSKAGNDRFSNIGDTNKNAEGYKNATKIQLNSEIVSSFERIHRMLSEEVERSEASLEQLCKSTDLLRANSSKHDEITQTISNGNKIISDIKKNELRDKMAIAAAFSLFVIVSLLIIRKRLVKLIRKFGSILKLVQSIYYGASGLTKILIYPFRLIIRLFVPKKVLNEIQRTDMLAAVPDIGALNVDPSSNQ